MSGRRKLGKLPRRPAKIVLGARDEFVLAAVAKARVLTTSDLALLAFPSVAIARRRLRRLHDGGFLAAYVDAYSTENRWTLDKAGLELLGRPGRYAPSQGPVSSLHRQLVVRLWVLLATACHREADATLTRFAFEWELSGAALPTGRHYRPDAVLRIAHPDGELVAMVEVDTGTEALRHLGEVKLPQIVELVRGGTMVGGVPVERVLFVAPNARRLGALLELATQVRLPAVGLVLAPRAERHAFDAGWHHPGGVVGGLFGGGPTSGAARDHGPRSEGPEITPSPGQTRPSDQGQPERLGE